MTRGNRSISAVPKGLVYNNLGTFFASRGITTLVPDYRRVDSKHGGEGAVSFPFPRVSWLCGNEVLM